MMVTLKLPRFGTNMVEGTLIAWQKKPGESFKEGDVLYDVETEKVTSSVEAPCNGTMVEIIAQESSIVPVGDPVCRIRKQDT